MSALLQDLRHSARSLLARPGFAAAALLTVAMGIGANVTVFSIVHALVLRPLPFGERSERVVTLYSTHAQQPEDWGWNDSQISLVDLDDFREAGALEALGGYMGRSFTLTGDEAAERVPGGSVTPDLFPLLGVEPVLGRHFHPDEAAQPGLERSVMLTHGLWQRRFGSRPEIVGQDVMINGLPRTVVGVLPPGFRFPERDQLYMPLRWDEAPRSARNVNGVGLLRPDVTLAEAQERLSATAARLEREYADSNRGFGVRVLAFRDSQIGAEERQLSAVLMAAVGFVLLIACANLANLLLVRGAGRQREMAVRAALGASRARLGRQLFLDAVVVSVPGAALGLLGAVWAIDAIRLSFPEELPYWLSFEIDATIAAFTVGAAIFTALAVGLAPAIRASRPDLLGDLKDGARATPGRAQQRLQGGLVVTQMALCLALLVGARLMIGSFLALQTTDLGFDHRPLVTMRAYLAGDEYDPVEARARFFADAASTLATLPGVVAASATTSIPGDDGGGGVRLVVDGRTGPDEAIGAGAVGVTAGIFDTLDVRLVEGRALTAAEVLDPDAHVTVVNETLARTFWPGGGAVGSRVGVQSSTAITWYRVVGIAPDIHYEEVGEATAQSRLTMYVPYAAMGYRTMALIARAEGAPGPVALAARSLLEQRHPNVPLYEVMTMAERRRFVTWEQEFFGRLMGVFAAMAVALASV
ncbi:MAG: ADOP family duplicated permease, partial [Vicinamibacteria bacterium]